MDVINNLDRIISFPTATEQDKKKPLYSREIIPIDSNLENTLREYFNLIEVGARFLASGIITLQAEIPENSGFVIEETEAIPYKLVLSKNAIFPVKAENFIGQGAFSKVYKVSMIATYSHQLGTTFLEAGKVLEVALKIWHSKENSTPSYSPEKRKLEPFLTPQKRGIDDYLATFKIPLVAGYSVHKLFDNSIDKFRFDKSNDPVKTIVTVLVSALQGLCSIHARNGIHRDIKGGNILALVTTDEIIGAITDCSLVKKEENKWHSTCGTPEYLDPVMFGTSSTTLFNQKKREGWQKKEGDIFAAGVTIIELLFFFLMNSSDRSIHKEKTIEIIKANKRQIILGPFSNEQLKEYGKKHPYRIMYRHAYQSQGEKLIFYPPLETLEEAFSNIYTLLREDFSPIEIKALKSLSSLACKMQSNKCRPTIYQVVEKLNSILESLNANESMKSNESFLILKKPKLEFPIDPKILTALSDEINGTIDSIYLLATQLLDRQKSLLDGAIAKLTYKEEVTFYLTNTEIHIEMDKFSSSAVDDSFSCISIPTIAHSIGHIKCSPGVPLTLIVKISKIQENIFLSQKEHLDKISKEKRAGIDDFLAIYSNSKGRGYSLNRHYTTSLAKVNFLTLRHPIFTMLKIIKQIVQGLVSIHSTNQIYRNIKENKILVSFDGNQLRVALTEFSLLTEVTDIPHYTIGTPYYFDPAMFGSIEDTLQNQIKRKGIQSKKGDLYSLGIMIIHKILYPYLYEILKNSDEDRALVESLMPIQYQGPFNDTKLRRLGIKHPYRAIYKEPYSKDAESVLAFQTIEQSRKTMKNILIKCENLPTKELQILATLSKLAFDMQEQENRPSIEEINEILKKLILKQLG